MLDILFVWNYNKMMYNKVIMAYCRFLADFRPKNRPKMGFLWGKMQPYGYIIPQFQKKVKR